MVDTTSLAEDLTRLEILLRALLSAGLRPGMPALALRRPGDGSSGPASEPGHALRLTPQQYHSCQVLLPALEATVRILRRLGRGLLALEPGSDEGLRHRFGLTRREIEVLRLLLLGRSNWDVARALGISEHTARHHTERVLMKLNVHSRAQLPAAIGRELW